MGSFCLCLKKKFQSENDNASDMETNLLSQRGEREESLTSTLSRDSNSSIRDINAKLEDFKRLKVLGKGSFGKVVLVQLINNKKLFAMKILKKRLVVKRKQIDHTKTERQIMEKLNHPFIVKLYYAFQDEKKLYFVTEFMQGGELFFHLRRNALYKDKAVVFYMSEILLAIEYMHNNNYIYRDLKPENILIDKFGHIKLTDFGLSKLVSDENKKTYTMCGTAEYLAPEVLFEKGYDKTCDWFSMGVVMFEMLCGYHPYPRKNNKIDVNAYMRPIILPNVLSGQAKDLISKLLETNPRKRLGYNGADEIKNHKYFNDIDFSLVKEKMYKPPFVPKLNDDFDLRYFDVGFTSEKVESLQDNNGINSCNFEGFSYQPPVTE